MKKTMKTLLAMMAGIMTFSACSNEDVLINENPNNTPEAKGVRIFKAFIESDVATRATIDGLDVKWDYDDAISIFDNSGNKKYKLTDGDGSTSGTFEATGSGVNDESDFYAIYPYANSTRDVSEEEAWSIASNYVTKDLFDKAKEGFTFETEDDVKWHNIKNSNLNWVEGFTKYAKTIPAYTKSGNEIQNGFLPIVQKVDVNKGQVVDPKAVLMVAKADENHSLPFKNACAYIKVTPTKPCKKIVVEANYGESIAGIFNVAIPAAPDAPTLSSIDGPSVITLQAKDGELAANTTYHIAVLPVALSKGLSVRFYSSDEHYTESTNTTPITLTRNKVYNGGKQPEDAALGINGTDKATIGGTIVEIDWVQLWAGGPRFAVKNVCETIGSEVSQNMTFTDAAKTGSEYVWGSNWYTPSMDDMSELMKAVQGDASAKVECTYGKVGSDFGFTFKGKGAYSENSIFLPVHENKGSKDDCIAYYWSSTADKGNGMEMHLKYDNGTPKGEWYSVTKSNPSYVRPVLKR